MTPLFWLSYYLNRSLLLHNVCYDFVMTTKPLSGKRCISLDCTSNTLVIRRVPCEKNSPDMCYNIFSESCGTECLNIISEMCFSVFLQARWKRVGLYSKLSLCRTSLIQMFRYLELDWNILETTVTLNSVVLLPSTRNSIIYRIQNIVIDSK